MLQKFHTLLNKGLSLAMAPIRLHPVLFLIGALLLFMPELARQASLRDTISYVSLHAATTVCFSFAISYMLCIIALLLGLIKPKVGTIAGIVLTALVFIYSFISVYVYKTFGIQNIASTLTLVLQTNSSEASEFLKTYIGDSRFIYTAIFYLVIGSISIALFIFKPCYIKVLRWIRQNGLLIILVIYALPLTIHKTSTFLYKEPRFFAGVNPLFDVQENQVYKDALAIMSMERFNVDIDFDKMVYDTRIDSITNDTTNVVLIIGESFNRHHSSLYGYSLNTNPKIAQLNPYVFTNVIAPVNVTVKAFKYLLSMEESNNKELMNSQLLCPLMKDAGYNVTFYSNQIIKSPDVQYWDLILDMLFSNPVIEKASFDHRNSKKFKEDGAFVDHFFGEVTEMENANGKNFTVIHLMGNHTNYSDRFPSTESIFKPTDIQRSELSPSEKQLVANYDNAILYNDKQIERIVDYYSNKDAIIIYLSDHGDEANDYRIHTGRIHTFDNLPTAALHCQLDVPFMIFATEKYKENHPEIIAKIEQSLDKPFMTDWLPYLILHLGGVHTGWNNPKKCLISPEYDTSRKRILDNGINYDEVCSPTDKVIGF